MRSEKIGRSGSQVMVNGRMMSRQSQMFLGLISIGFFMVHMEYRFTFKLKFREDAWFVIKNSNLFNPESRSFQISDLILIYGLS